MFFIVNYENSIIAADTDFLEGIGAHSIYEATSLIQNGKVTLNELEQSISYLQQSKAFSKIKLSTILGDTYLYKIDEEEKQIIKESFQKDESFILSSSQETLTEDEELIETKEKTETYYDEELYSFTEEEIEQEELELLNDDPLIPSKPNETIETPPKIEIPNLSTSAITNTEKDIQASEETLGLIDTSKSDEAWFEDTLSLSTTEEESTNLEILNSLEITETDPENEILVPGQAEDISDKGENSLSLSEAIGLAGAGVATGTLLNKEDTVENPELDDEPLILLKETDEEISVVDEGKEETDTPQEDDEILSLIDTPAEDQETDIGLHDEELFNLAVTDDKSAEEILEQEETDTHSIPNEVTLLQEDVGVNTSRISKLIGVSEEEYIHFLEDFRKESSSLESHLRSNDLKESREAISILKETSLLLHLPHITEKLSELTNATSDEKEEIIDNYLALVTETSISKELETPYDEAPTVSIDTKAAAESIDVVHPEEIIQTEETEEKEKHPDLPIKALSDTEQVALEEVQAIPFDFSINEAAEELTLPSSLVSEFIIDFINQAKENLPVLHKAYEDSDLDTLQKTAHMLKGASSNLRITPMADTLYNLQFNDDLSQVPDLIKLFTGQLKALSIQMDQVS